MANDKSNKDKEMAAYMKRMGIERTSGICALCYRRISVTSAKSNYTHICPGGKIRHN